MLALDHKGRTTQHHPEVVTTGTTTTSQIWPYKTCVRSHPLWDGIHDGGLDLTATWTDESHDPNDQDRGLQLLKDDQVIDDLRVATNSPTTPRKPGDKDKYHGRDHVA